MVDTVAIVREFLATTVAAPASSTLTAGITAAATTMTLVSGATFPANQSFVVKIDSEWIHVTRTTNTLNVETWGRGAFGTTAAAHALGATVSLGNLYQIVGGAIMCPLLHSGYENTSPAIVFQTRGGDAEIRHDLLKPSFQFKCFGGSASPRDAKAVYRALRDRFNGQHGQDTGQGR